MLPNSRNRHVHVSAGARERDISDDTKYLSVKHFSLHFCRGDTCNKVSFRHQELTIKIIDFTRTSHVDIRRDNVLETEYFIDNVNVHIPVIDIADLSAILYDDLLYITDLFEEVSTGTNK